MDPSQIDTEFDDLERRLLALTFTLPRQSDAPALQSASVAALDVETMGAYLRGELNEAQLRAFESDIRGNPLRFAELLAFKDAYLGRPRALRQVVPRLPPPIERVEVGVLSIRRLGKRATLEWQGAESDDLSAVDFLKVAAMRRPAFDFRQVRDSSSLSGLGYLQVGRSRGHRETRSPARPTRSNVHAAARDHPRPTQRRRRCTRSPTSPKPTVRGRGDGR